MFVDSQGSVRALNADLLDAYLLKSIDGGLQQGRLELGADSMAVFRCGDGGRQRYLLPFRRSLRFNSTSYAFRFSSTYSKPLF